MWEAMNEFLYAHDIRDVERVRKTFDVWTEKGRSCHLWQGSKDSYGYGRMHIYLVDGTRKVVSAHRLSWILHYGYLEKKLNVLHICIFRSCVNPDHLYLGNAKNNSDDYRLGGKLREELVKIIADKGW